MLFTLLFLLFFILVISRFCVLCLLGSRYTLTVQTNVVLFFKGDHSYYLWGVHIQYVLRPLLSRLCMPAPSLQSCQTPCNPTDCSPRSPLSMGFSRQEHWSGLPCSPSGVSPMQGSNPGLPCCRWILYHWATKEAPKDRYWLINIYKVSKILKFIEAKSRMVITKSWGWGGARSCLMSLEFQIFFSEKILVMYFTILWIYLTLLNCTLKMVNSI